MLLPTGRSISQISLSSSDAVGLEAAAAGALAARDWLCVGAAPPVVDEVAQAKVSRKYEERTSDTRLIGGLPLRDGEHRRDARARYPTTVPRTRTPRALAMRVRAVAAPPASTYPFQPGRSGGRVHAVRHQLDTRVRGTSRRASRGRSAPRSALARPQQQDRDGVD